MDHTAPEIGRHLFDSADQCHPVTPNIIECTLVPHCAFEDALSRLAQCFKYSICSTEPICLAIIGESRTGKSRVLEEFQEDHKPFRNKEGLTVPILKVTTPSKPTVKSFVELMLVGMGDPMAHIGTENKKTLRLKTLMKNAETRMVIIDEFQHFQDKGSNKIMHHVADWLKGLVDETHVALVVAGLASCRAVIYQNEQLAGRFLAPVILPRFDWTIELHREEFTGILKSFFKSLSAEFLLPELEGSDLPFRFYCATGGLIGYLSKLLRQIEWSARDLKMRTLSLESFSQAHRISLWHEQNFLEVPNPFSTDFDAGPNAELFAVIRKIGTRPDENCQPDYSGRKNAQISGLNRILSAR